MKQALAGGDINLVICGHLNLLPAAWLLARFRRARLALIIHGIEAWASTRNALVNRLARSVDSVIAVSHYSAARFSTWSKVSFEQASIIPNCVDLHRFRPEHRDPMLVERYSLQAHKVLLTVGRLAPEERYKGFDEVIESMPHLLKRFPKLRYLIVGDGADRSRLQAKAITLGVADNVIFTGWIPESEKVAHYNLADAYVMPTSGEGFGIVLIEAAACGIPVIGSGLGGSREALLDGRLGRLVDPKKPLELQEAVLATLEGKLSRRRNPLIEQFSVQAFNARVNEWCYTQVSRVEKWAARQQ
jgi:phosphatidylinositol alpha-1,6-mannosyltransferase